MGADSPRFHEYGLRARTNDNTIGELSAWGVQSSTSSVNTAIGGPRRAYNQPKGGHTMPRDADDSRRTLGDLDQSLAPPPPTRALADDLELGLAPSDLVIDPTFRHTDVSMVVAIGGILVMMAIGAAAALLMFQDRIAQLFR